MLEGAGSAQARGDRSGAFDTHRLEWQLPGRSALDFPGMRRASASDTSITVKVDDELARRVVERAKDEDANVSQIVRRALRAYLARPIVQ